MQSTRDLLILSPVVIASAFFALGLSPLPTGHPSPPAPAPVAPGWGMSGGTPGNPQIAGTMVRANGCDAFDVTYGQAPEQTVMLRWTEPASRRDWLQTEFDRRLEAYGGDLWEAFVELGGGLRQSSSGFAIETQATGQVADCGGMDLPVLDVEQVLGAWDVMARRPLAESVQPLDAGGLSTHDSEVATVLRAGRAARDGHQQQVVIRVGGVTDPSLGCPPWALGSAGSVDYDCGSRRGFVELQFERPELAPNPGRRLSRLLEERGLSSFSDLSEDEGRELREQAIRSVMRGPFHFRGHFTGEVSFRRGTEALFITPVFVVEGRE